VRSAAAAPCAQRRRPGELRLRLTCLLSLSRAPTPALPGEGAPIEVRVPDIGDFKDVAVIELLVKPGDTIKQEQSLITVESDKASMEIPSSAAGVLKELKVKIGDKVNIGDLIAMLQGSAAGASPSPQPSPQGAREQVRPALRPGRAPAAERTPPTGALPPHEPGAPTGNLPHASPSVRKFARELGVPLEEVKGTGPRAASRRKTSRASPRP
jgi:pyruvate dehydrogenase E2 component (dihydrolipoamide acetyltransferase)